MPKRFFLITVICLICLAWLCSCHGKPWGVITPKEMEDLTYDLTLLDASIQTYNVGDTVLIQRFYSEVFEKHSVSKEKYQESLQWYAENAKELEQIYERVSQRMDSLRSEVEDYRFHPELKAEANASLDTVELIEFDSLYIFDKTPEYDSLKFNVKKGTIYSISDRYIFTADISVEATDTAHSLLKNSTIELYIAYNNNKRKHLKKAIIADGKRYRYTFYPTINDTAKVARIYVNLFNSKDTITSLKVENISLRRIYDSEKYPMPNRSLIVPEGLQKAPGRSTVREVFKEGKSLPHLKENLLKKNEVLQKEESIKNKSK